MNVVMITWRIESRREEAEVLRDTRLAGRVSRGSLLGSSTIRIWKINFRLSGISEVFYSSWSKLNYFLFTTYFEDLLLMQRRGIYSAFLSSHQTAHKSPNLIWSKPGFEFLPSLPPKAGEGPGLGWWVVHLPRLNRDLYWHFDKFCLVRVIAMFASLA